MTRGTQGMNRAMRKKFNLFVVVLLLAGCGRPVDKPATEQAVVVEVAPVIGGAGTATISGTGSLERERQIVMSFRDPGMVSRVFVDSGDAVRRGQLLARQDTTQLAMQSTKARADYDKAVRDYERDKKLAAQGWISGQRLADRETVAKSAKAVLDSVNFDKFIGTIVAPSDGVVLMRHIQSGEVVNSGTPVITMADNRSPLVVRVALADKDVARVRLGDSALVTVSALPGVQLQGRVSRIDQRVDPRTGATDVDVRVPSHPGLKTGFVAETRITLRAGSLGGVARIPAEAIIEAHGNTAFVFVLDAKNNRARRTQVGFAGFEGDAALVRGLGSNQSVVTTGGALVRDGSLLSVQNADA